MACLPVSGRTLGPAAGLPRRPAHAANRCNHIRRLPAAQVHSAKARAAALQTDQGAAAANFVGWTGAANATDSPLTTLFTKHPVASTMALAWSEWGCLGGGPCGTGAARITPRSP